MGNSHGHHGSSKHKSSTSQSTSEITSRKSFSKSNSGNEIEENKHFNNFECVVKLTKILSNKTSAEERVLGISLNVFTKYLFPRYHVLATKLFNYFHKLSKSSNNYIETQPFIEQCAKYLQILDDATMSDILVKMFSVENQDNNNETITPELLKMLLMSSYHISMDHYSEGPQSCYFLHQTLKAIVDSCFHVKNSLSTSFVSHWLQSNCPRILQPVHRFIVHTLATAYRTLEEKNEIDLVTGLELATPVLEKSSSFAASSASNGKNTPSYTLNMSLSWLLASALPPLYSMPQKANSPEGSSNGLSSMLFLTRMLSSIPSHWVLIYDSNQHGLGANRFLHHVLAYKGPTLVILKSQEDSIFCVACPDEWHESHHYWGREESGLYQLLPKFGLMEKGPKMLYLNLTARGYPYGLRVGSNPRSPIISIDGGFEKIEYSKIPDKLTRVEVWGCGDAVSRDRQLEVKKWEVREAEKQRVVKLSASEWVDHPDRYLLELAGRPQYSTT